MTKVKIKIKGAKDIQLNLEDGRRLAQKIIKNTMMYGVIDGRGNWYPPSQVKGIEFDPDPGLETPFIGPRWGK